MKDGEKEKDCLIISTIHSAKGLEADSCFAMKLTISMNHLEWIIIERGYFPQNFNDLIVLY
jgi:ATP-dependent exoDNAse (exonuclease V) beta subunit